MTAMWGYLTHGNFQFILHGPQKGERIPRKTLEDNQMSAFTDFLAKHKISIGVVGTTVVLATAYGSCQFTPELPEAPVGEEAGEEAAEDAPPVEDAAPTEPSDEEKIEKEEEAAEEQPPAE